MSWFPRYCEIYSWGNYYSAHSPGFFIGVFLGADYYVGRAQFIAL